MPIATVLLELGAVVLGLGLLGRLADRVGLSPIPLYLLEGLAFGSGGLAPISVSADFVETGAEVGVVLLLLVLGLEYSAAELVGNLTRQAPIGLLDLTVNAAPGVIVALLLGWGPVAAVAMGGVTAVSSSAIVAKVLHDSGRLGNRETPAVLSILVLEDLGMAIYLPVLTALLAAATLGSLATAVGIAVASLVLVLMIAIRFGHPLSRLISSPSPEVLLLSILGLALLVAGAAEWVHVSAAVGAFLLGIALSGELAENARSLLEPLRDLFAAVFFVLFGLRTDPGSIPPVLGPVAALVVAGIATKMVSGWFAARRAGVAVPGRIRAGAALVPRGEFSIVIAGLAVTDGVRGNLGPTAGAYVLLMGIIGPLAPKLADPLARRAARRTHDRREATARLALSSGQAQP